MSVDLVLRLYGAGVALFRSSNDKERWRYHLHLFFFLIAAFEYVQILPSPTQCPQLARYSWTCKYDSVLSRAGCRPSVFSSQDKCQPKICFAVARFANSFISWLFSSSGGHWRLWNGTVSCRPQFRFPCFCFPTSRRGSEATVARILLSFIARVCLS